MHKIYFCKNHNVHKWQSFFEHVLMTVVKKNCFEKLRGWIWALMICTFSVQEFYQKEFCASCSFILYQETYLLRYFSKIQNLKIFIGSAEIDVFVLMIPFWASCPQTEVRPCAHYVTFQCTWKFICALSSKRQPLNLEINLLIRMYIWCNKQAVSA